MQLGPDLERLVRRIAIDEKRPVEAVVADAVRDYAERAKARSGFVEEADAAWDDYCATGLHITGPEARDWLKGWGGTASKASPACHD